MFKKLWAWLSWLLAKLGSTRTIRDQNTYISSTSTSSEKTETHIIRRGTGTVTVIRNGTNIDPESEEGKKMIKEANKVLDEGMSSLDQSMERLRRAMDNLPTKSDK